MITLATLEQATAQQVFTQVKNHLLKQNEKSMINGICAYRGSNGLQCAAGCLMSDEEANKLRKVSLGTCLFKMTKYHKNIRN